MDTPQSTSCQNCGKPLIETPRFFLCPNCGSSFPNEPDKTPTEKRYPSRNIFLSYGHDSYAPFAYRLKESLEKRGHRVWVDQELKVGKDWEIKIEKALQDIAAQKPNACLLLLMTEHSVRRPGGYCLNELAYAIQHDLLTIPIKLEPVSPPLSIARIQYFDLSQLTEREIPENFYEQECSALFEALEQDKLDFDGLQSRLLTRLRPIEFKSETRKYMSNFVGRRWILDHIKSWLSDSEGSRVFWLQGGPGVGKTAISIWLSCRQLPEIQAWHLCQHSDSVTSNPSNCILSIAYYLSTHLPDYFQKLNTLNLEELATHHRNTTTLFKRVLIDPLNELTPREKPVVILIDALDEAAPDNNNNELAEFIGTHFKEFPQWIRFIITSRPVNEICKWLSELNPFVLETSDERNLSDLEEYIRQELSTLNGSAQQKNEIVQSILTKSEGTILYAKYVCEAIRTGEIDPLKPEKYPVGLNNIYEQYFRRRFPETRAYERDIAPLLQLVAASRGPLLYQELAGYLKSTNEKWDHAFFNTLWKKMGGLFQIVDETVIPFHKSVTDWLCQHVHSDYHISREEGVAGLIRWGESYIRNRRYNEIPCYFLNHLVYHLLSQKKYDEAICLLSDIDFIQTRERRLGIDCMLDLFMEELCLLPEEYRVNLYREETFTRILYRYKKSFLDKALFIELKKYGYSITNHLNKMSNPAVVIALYYWYINQEYNVIEQNVSAFERITDEDKGAVLNLLGLSFKKMGRLQPALRFLEESLRYHAAENNPNRIYNYVNLSRIYIILNQKPEAELSLSKAKQLLEQADCTDLSAFDVRQLEIAVHYVSLENKLYDKDFQKRQCLDDIDWADNLYADTNKIDRYYVRHLTSKSLYWMRAGDLDKAEACLQESQKYIKGKYDDIKYNYFSALLLFLRHAGNQNPLYLEEANRLIRICRPEQGEFPIECTEFRALEQALCHFAGLATPPFDVSNPELKFWFEHWSELFISTYRNQLKKS